MAAALPTPIDCFNDHCHCANQQGSTISFVNTQLQGDGPPTGGIYDPPSDPLINWSYDDRLTRIRYFWNTTAQAWQ